MDKNDLRAIIARNIKEAMSRSESYRSANALAKKAQVSQSHLSKVLRGEAAFSTDILLTLSDALGMQPWELLADAEETRRLAIERLIGRPAVPDSKVEKHLPPAPVKEVAARQRKKDEAGKNPPSL